MRTVTWPEPYLQPDRNKDCSFYAQAYVARCLGRTEVTAQDVMDWKQAANRGETRYVREAHAADAYGFWDAERDGGEEARRPFWLGPAQREWVCDRTAAGWVAQVMVNRKAGMGHAVVLLDGDNDGVLLMDPVFGHVTEPWAWFLGPGPKSEAAEWPGSAPDGRAFWGCHFIEGWYRT